MKAFDIWFLILGSNALTYWLILKDDPKKSDKAGLIGLGGATLVGYVVFSGIYS